MVLAWITGDLFLRGLFSFSPFSFLMDLLSCPLVSFPNAENTMDINKDEYLNRFKVYNSQTLFGPDFSLLEQNRCPLCGMKLHIRADKKLAFCRSKYKDKFVIGAQRLLSLGGSLA